MNFGISALYVGELHPEVTEYMLLEKFSTAGLVHSIQVCRNWNISLNYAYINFYHQFDAERALATLNWEPLMGKPMKIMWSKRNSTRMKSNIGNLFIKNLDLKTIDSMALFDLFSGFGKVLSCKVISYKTGTKGYGYVQFESPEAAILAKEKLDGKLFNDLKVSIEHFKSRKERKAKNNLCPEVQLQPGPAHSPDVEETLALPKAPAVEEKPASPEAPAVEEKPAPVQNSVPSASVHKMAAEAGVKKVCDKKKKKNKKKRMNNSLS